MISIAGKQIMEAVLYNQSGDGSLIVQVQGRFYHLKSSDRTVPVLDRPCTWTIKEPSPD